MKTTEDLIEDHAEWFSETLIKILKPVIKITFVEAMGHGIKHNKEGDQNE